ncbi:MAG: hypothetical protein ACMUIP_00840 [bacterium]
MQVQNSYIIAATSAIIVFLAIICLTHVPSHANKIVILPFENMSGHFEAFETVMNVVYQLVGEQANVVPAQKVESQLIKLQLRHTAYLTTSDAASISKGLGACSILTGMICLYEESPSPKFGLIIKLYDSKKDTIPIIWMDSAALDANETESWLGKKKFTDINQLTNYIFKNMLKRMPLDCAKK